MKRFAWLLGALSLTVAVCGCELNDPISNGDLDEWCGDKPCGWDKRGKVERVSTWHAHDYAASFEEDGAQLSQLNSELDSYECLSFSMVARVSRADMGFVELDFLDDGSIEWSEPIPPGDFRSLEFRVYAPSWYEGVRFIVRKEGEGEMVLASIHADIVGSGSCSGEQIVLRDLPGGAPCTVNENCATEMCLGSYCVGCESDDDCEGGKVCGYDSASSGFASLNVLPLCIEPGTRPLGELCVGDAECETGVCCEGACSECCGESGCEGERVCTRALAGDGEGSDVREPFLCSAGEQTGQEGDACTSSHECEGSCIERQCTGLCLPITSSDIKSRCAMLACDEVNCSYRCEVETVEVGTCD
jgi:hypothetical protein